MSVVCGQLYEPSQLQVHLCRLQSSMYENSLFGGYLLPFTRHSEHDLDSTPLQILVDLSEGHLHEPSHLQSQS